MSPFAISLLRYDAIDFCGFIGGSGTSILVRYPPPPTISDWGMIQPFSFQIIEIDSYYSYILLLNLFILIEEYTN